HRAQPLLGLAHEPLDRVAIAHVALDCEHAHAHRREGGLGEQRLLAHVAARHVDEAESDVAAQLAELDRDVTAQAGGAPGHDRDLPAPPPGHRLRLGLLERGSASLRALVLPRGPVAEAEGWQGHGLRRYGSLGVAARRAEPWSRPWPGC